MDPHPVRPLTPAPAIARGAVLAVRPDPDGGQQFVDDLAFAAEIGLQQVRLDVPWAAAQPRPGTVDGAVFEQLQAAALAAQALGIEPWFRLLQPSVPHWFDNEGGFTDDRTAGTWWPRWIEAVTNHLGGVAAGWVPMEAPFAMATRLVPDDPRRHGELIHNLVVAWRDAWRILRGGQPVATSLDVATERPADETVQAAEAARRRDQLRWGTWLGGLYDGVVRIPGRADRPLDDLAGACDIVGLALSGDVATALYRAADQGPPRPLALTFRPRGATDTEHASAVSSMWREVRSAASDLTIVAVTAAVLLDSAGLDEAGLDSAGRPGLATADRRLKDSGEAFLSG